MAPAEEKAPSATFRNHTTVWSRGGLLEKGDIRYKTFSERKQVIAIEKYHHEEHEGHEVEFDY